MRRGLLILPLAGLALFGAAFPDCIALHGDSAPWVEDFRRLRAHMNRAYANLVWCAEHRSLDLAELSRTTEQRLADAHTLGSARDAVTDFVAAFQDPHFRVEKPRSAIFGAVMSLWNNDDEGPLTPDLNGDEFLSRLGFESDDHDFRLPFLELERARLLDGDQVFAAAIVPLPGGGRLGVVRIATFGGRRHPELGRIAWDEMRSEFSGPLDDAQTWRVLLRVQQILLDRLEQTLEQLSRSGIDALLVDVSDNGGGTDWDDPAARMLTRRPLRAPGLAFVRHPHWTDRLDRQAEELAARATELSGGDRDLVETALERLRQAVRAGREIIDLGPIWERGVRPEDPSPLVDQLLFSTGPFGYLPADALTGVAERSTLFSPLQYRYREGVFSGPLYVLQNRNTASASEYFCAMLRDNEAATLIGERTLGAGAGYTGSGLPIQLQSLDLTIRLPDLARLRGNGDNELLGISPDLALSWELDEEERLERLLALIEQHLGR